MSGDLQAEQVAESRQKGVERVDREAHLDTPRDCISERRQVRPLLAERMRLLQEVQSRAESKQLRAELTTLAECNRDHSCW